MYLHQDVNTVVTILYYKIPLTVFVEIKPLTKASEFSKGYGNKGKGSGE